MFGQHLRARSRTTRQESSQHLFDHLLEPPKYLSLMESKVFGEPKKPTKTYLLSLRTSPHLCHEPEAVFKITIKRNKYRDARRRIIRKVTQYYGRREILPNRYALGDYSRAQTWKEVSRLCDLRRVAEVTP